MTLDEFLARIEPVALRRSGQGYVARCPAHDDHAASLSLGEGDDGRILLHCFAGCTAEAIAAAYGLSTSDLFPAARGEGAVIPPGAPATVQPCPGCTLSAYAAAKRLPEAFLASLGVSEISYQGHPAVRMPYVDAQGAEVAVRFRLETERGAGIDNRFRWKRGAKPCLYGLGMLAAAREQGRVVLVEGESDAQTLLYHGIPAVGLPGASSWQEAWASELDEIPVIYVVIEPDQGGEAMRAWLSKSRLRERARLIVMSGAAKDPSALYLDDSARFAERFAALIAGAAPWREVQEAESEAAAASAWSLCKELAEKPVILDTFAESLSASGVAGEARVAKLIYLALSSRLLPRPCSVAVKGPSGGGKSYLAEAVCGYFPESAVYALSGMSERALAYSKEPLSHRFLVLYEAVGMQSDFVSYLIRSLLSEGRIRYETVVKTKGGGMEPMLIEREGPTGLLVTTTAVSLHPENETRLLSIPVTDSREQTAAVLAAIAAGGEQREGDDRGCWHALQTWLESGEQRVVVPYARQLAALVPPVAVRLRRDFATLLALICAHALLHRASRARDEPGRIVAAIADYVVVRQLVADLIAETLEATVAPTVRETVSAVGRLHSALERPVTYKQLGEALLLDKSAAQRRARVAMGHGYLKNLETRRGQPAQLVCAEPLPNDVEILPAPELLDGCAVAGGPAEHSTPSPSELEGVSR